MKDDQIISLKIDKLPQKSEAPVLLSEDVEISDGLSHHIMYGKPIYKNVYKTNTPEFFELLDECRRLVEEGKLKLRGVDVEFVKQTNN